MKPLELMMKDIQDELKELAKHEKVVRDIAKDAGRSKRHVCWQRVRQLRHQQEILMQDKAEIEKLVSIQARPSIIVTEYVCGHCGKELASEEDFSAHVFDCSKGPIGTLCEELRHTLKPILHYNMDAVDAYIDEAREAARHQFMLRRQYDARCK